MPAADVAARKPGRAPALPPDERRSMIVAAALPLVVQRGEAVTTHEIAAAAGIAEGTIFRAFPTKDALIEAVIDHALDTSAVERALEGIDAGAPLEEALTAAVALFQRRVVGVWQLMSSVGTRFESHARRPFPDSPALVRLFEAHRREVRVEPAAAARSLRAITMALTHPMLAIEPVDAAEVTRRFLHGVAAC